MCWFAHHLRNIDVHLCTPVTIYTLSMGHFAHLCTLVTIYIIYGTFCPFVYACHYIYIIYGTFCPFVYTCHYIYIIYGTFCPFVYACHYIHYLWDILSICVRLSLFIHYLWNTFVYACHYIHYLWDILSICVRLSLYTLSMGHFVHLCTLVTIYINYGTFCPFVYSFHTQGCNYTLTVGLLYQGWHDMGSSQIPKYVISIYKMFFPCTLRGGGRGRRGTLRCGWGRAHWGGWGGGGSTVRWGGGAH